MNDPENHGQESDRSDKPNRGKRHWQTLISLLLIIGLIFLNRWLFRIWFDIDYIRWYLDNGALFSIVFGFVGLAGAKPDESIGLISLNPARYLEAVFDLTTWPLLAASEALDSSQYGRSLANSLLLVPLSFILLGGVILFLIVGAPLQYFIHAVCGAPGRAVHDAVGVRSYWIVQGDKIRTRIVKSPKGELPDELVDSDRYQRLREQLSEIEETARTTGTPEETKALAQLRQQMDEEMGRLRVTEVEFADKPLALTSAFSALVLWIAGQFVG
jgi:hypothetical protein